MALTKSYIFFSALHFVCFALALTICGIYGPDVHHQRKYDGGASKRFVYALVVAVLSAVTSLVYFVPLIVRRAGIITAGWNLVLFLLWIIVFGLFASAFLKRNPSDGYHRRMRSSVWVDLVNALLWLISALAMIGYWWKHRNNRSQFTGRAHV